uniref:EGF-like domain-containing protein n=1 Tax=Magallana gigas TaxID=29159 RepID=K1QRR9_MAGGI
MRQGVLDWFVAILIGDNNVVPTVLYNRPTQCVIVQDKMSIFTPQTPSFLSNNNKTECQVHGAEDGFLRCGTSNMYIKPECVCTFHNVYEAMYHQFSSCPHGDKSDVVTQLKCHLNNNGPCINGGKIKCEGDEVAPDITCECPPPYQGMFCEEKMENIIRLCDRISNSTAAPLKNCDHTKTDCVTYSRNRRYAFKCYETHASQIRELLLCEDTEDITESLAVTDVPYWIVPEDPTTVRGDSINMISTAGIHLSTHVLIMKHALSVIGTVSGGNTPLPGGCLY